MIVVVLFVLFFLGMPIAFSIITTVAGYLIVTDARPLILVAQRCYAGLDSVACLAVPLFTLAGYLMEKGGISKRLVDWVGMLLGGIRGSLGIVAVVTCTIFAALTGSGPATVCAIGGILYLPMVQSGYPEKMANGLIAAGGSLGPIIPPSIAMIVYASTMGTSITKMFAGALIPGLVISLTLCVTVYFQARKYNIPVRKEKHAFKEFLKATVNAFGVLLIPVVVLGGIYGGFVTTTEAAALACVMSPDPRLPLQRAESQEPASLSRADRRDQRHGHVHHGCGSRLHLAAQRDAAARQAGVGHRSAYQRQPVPLSAGPVPDPAAGGRTDGYADLCGDPGADPDPHRHKSGAGSAASGRCLLREPDRGLHHAALRHQPVHGLLRYQDTIQ